MSTWLKAHLGKQLCPYCFEHYPLRRAPFRCTTHATKCSPEVDSVLRAAWDDRRPVGKVIDPPRRLVHHVRCPDCKHDSRQRICPHCHIALPQTTGKTRQLIFALIGAKETGKSHYIAVLINHLRNHVGPALDILLEPLDDRTIDRYRTDFYDPIYRKGRCIDNTSSGLVDQDTRKPLVYSLSFHGRNALGRRVIKSVVTLVFFDTAGEDLNDQDTMSTVNKYIYRSDGLLLLLDPLQLEPVRDRLSSDVELPDQNTDSSEIITRTTRLIQQGRNLSATAQIGTPLAVTFSKFDAVSPLVDPQMQLNQHSNHIGGFDEGDFTAVNGEMEALLQKWDGQPLLHQVRSHYPRHAFFGITALGCNPSGKRIPRVIPRRVEDPFLWLLRQHRLIGAARRTP